MGFGRLAWEPPIFYSFSEKTNSELCLRIWNTSFNLLLFLSPLWRTQIWPPGMHFIFLIIFLKKNRKLFIYKTKFLKIEHWFLAWIFYSYLNWPLVLEINPLLMLPQPTSCKNTYYSLKEHRKPTCFLGHMGERSKNPSY